MSDTLIGCIKQSLGTKTIEVEVPDGYEVILKRKKTKVKDLKDDELVVCCLCNEYKDKTNYSPSCAVSSNLRTGYCRECRRIYQKLKTYKNYK